MSRARKMVNHLSWMMLMVCPRRSRRHHHICYGWLLAHIHRHWHRVYFVIIAFEQTVPAKVSYESWCYQHHHCWRRWEEGFGWDWNNHSFPWGWRQWWRQQQQLARWSITWVIACILTFPGTFSRSWFQRSLEVVDERFDYKNYSNDNNAKNNRLEDDDINSRFMMRCSAGAADWSREWQSAAPTGQWL